VRFVPVDFGRDDIGQALTSSGFSSGRRTLVLWEGVTNYLSAEAVDATFRFLTSIVASGSPLLFTYVDSAILDGSREFEGAHESSAHVRRVGEPYTFGFDPSQVGEYLAERGIHLVGDEVVSDAAARFYSADGRPKGYAYYHVVEARTS
jgi:methyltransferase (TIGR00027 family)